MDPRTGRARGALVGLAVGDALGGPLEFMSVADARAAHGGPVREMVGGGWLHLTPGQTTDDTAMALALARSLDACGGYDEDDALARYLAWRATGPPDIGITVEAVLGAVAGGAAPREATAAFHARSGGKSAGNGTLMRIAPLALRHHDEPDALRRAVRADSTLTHFDPLAADACTWACLRIAALLSGEDAAPEPEGDPRIAEVVVPDRAAAAERAVAWGGFVLAALAVGATAVATAPSFEEGLVWAVNLGGDADTNGAVAGALLGARFGEVAIPSRWTAPVREAEELGALAERLAGH